MIRQYLSQTNESATLSEAKNFCKLNNDSWSGQASVLAEREKERRGAIETKMLIVIFFKL
jgi:hypothetical protein